MLRNLWGKYGKTCCVFHVLQYIKQKRQCFIGVSKHKEEEFKMWCSAEYFDQIWDVWIADETLSQVFDITSQSKQKLKSAGKCER